MNKFTILLLFAASICNGNDDIKSKLEGAKQFGVGVQCQTSD